MPEAGPNAERLFLIQMLPDILKQVIQAVDNLSIDKLTVFDSGNGTEVLLCLIRLLDLPGSIGEPQSINRS